jgi:DNA-binding response OmpR family regulator
VAHSTALLFSPDGQDLPAALRTWLDGRAIAAETLRTADELMSLAFRGRPTVVVFDARGGSDEVFAACRRLKADSYTGIVPAAVFAADSDEALQHAFDVGADEVIRSRMSTGEVEARMDVLLRRSSRDTLVHPSTRLPGTVEIEHEIGARLARGVKFAACYADWSSSRRTLPRLP